MYKKEVVSFKYDIDTVCAGIDSRVIAHFLDDYDNETLIKEDVFEMSLFSKTLGELRASYCAPAVLFNEYCDSYVAFCDSMDNDAFLKANIFIMYCFISIKTGLDRTVQLFGLIDRVIKGSHKMTFGHLHNDLGELSPKHFMKHVNMKKDQNDLFEYVYEQYNEWIEECVNPRNEIVHYKDLDVVISYNEILEGYEPTVLISKTTFEEEKEILSVDLKKMKDYVDHYYSFYSHIIDEIAKRTTKRV